jgi:carotenoid 1,2-hydratase
MPAAIETRSEAKLSFVSSISFDVWHQNKSQGAYEWWYFDAMSDDGTEAVVICFLDNSVFSPRYNRRLNTGSAKDTVGRPPVENPASTQRFPAVFFAYYRNGKPFYRAFNEFTAGELDADNTSPACRIGESGFRFDSAPYGSGYSIHISSALGRGRVLEAKFEWLSIESDFHRGASNYPVDGHILNMVATRSDVSGRISVFDKKGASKDVRHFRGTGYHDHEADSRWFADTLSEKFWGRAHFADTTAIFQKFKESGCDGCTKLFIVKDGGLSEREVRCEEKNFVRNKFGIKYPSRTTLTSDDGIRLRIKPIKVLDSSFYALRFASEMTLTMRDGKPRKSMGITELVAPKTLKYRWLDWINDMRILRVR